MNVVYACWIAGALAVFVGFLFVLSADPVDEDRFWFRMNIAEVFSFTGVGLGMGGMILYFLFQATGVP